MAEDKNNLKSLKKEYSVLQKKYKLPVFDELNLYFDIERVAEKETDFLMREIRRQCAEKIYLYLKFCEMIMNPTNAPLFMFPLIKNLSQSDKKSIDDLYKHLAQFDIDMMELDLDYSEKHEAEFIISLAKEWKKTNNLLLSIVKVFRNSTVTGVDRNNKGYFG